MKRRIFLFFVFTVFLRLQIYEAIAAIFWQSASYVAMFYFSFTNIVLTNSSFLIKNIIYLFIF